MKKLFCFALATLILLTALVGCNIPPVTPDKNPTEQPGTTDPGTTDPGTTDPGTTYPDTTDPGTTDPGTSVNPLPPALNDGDIEKTTEHTVGTGKFVFKEKKFAYADGHIVLMDVKNDTDENYTLKLHATYFNEAGEEILKETRTIKGFAAQWETPVLLWPQTAFATYTYTVETIPYDGICWGKNYTVEYTGLTELPSVMQYLVGTAVETNNNTTPFRRCLTVILFNNKGEVHCIASQGIEQISMPMQANLGWLCTAYSTTDKKLVWPETLTGDLKCVIIPYFSDDVLELWSVISDIPKFFPDVPPPDPSLWQ